MAWDFNGTTDNIRFITAPVTAVPLTMSGWAYADGGISGGDNEITIFSLSDFDYNVGGNSQEFTIELAIQTGVTGAVAVTGSAGTGGFAVSTTFPTEGAWYNVIGVFTSATSRTVYLNGGGSGTDVTNVTPTNISDIGVGTTFKASAGSKFFNGKLAEIGLWNRVLTATEIATLALGYAPSTIPQSLMFYSSLIAANNPEINTKNSVTGTITGAVRSTHPDLIKYPGKSSGSQLRPRAFSPGLAR